MNRVLVLVFICFFIQEFKAQDIVNKDLDSLYREDQFYIGVVHNFFENTPRGFSQTGFSPGFNFGFIRDMPINKDRTLAIGLGLGYSINSFNQNLLINKDDLGTISYTILEDSNTFSKNRFTTHLLEAPFEFRWRTSTAADYNFWRFYAGFKFSYMFANKTKYRGNLGNFNFANIDTFNKLQYGLTLSAGYNTWNIYVCYTLNPIFSNDVKLNGEDLNMNIIKAGLIFYIL